MNKMWRYVQSYRLVKPGVMDEDPTFYINDEVGCSVAHNDDDDDDDDDDERRRRRTTTDDANYIIQFNS